MVETLLSPIIEKLIDLVIEEAKSLKGVHKQVKSLQKELEIIEPLLHDAEAKSARGELSDASKVWMRQLREEAEHIEDVVDEYTYYAEQHRQSQAGFFGSLRKAGHRVKTFKTRRDLASEIRDVKRSLREIKERGLSYGLRPFEQGGSSSGGVGQNSRIDPRIGSLFVDDDELVGIESMSTELVSIFTERFSERTVVALVGEGGIGKTTLARKLYNDVVEKGSFEIYVWVTVSQSYDIDKILKILIAKICPSGVELVAVEEAFALLRSSLQAKRYVIVFDDVWQNDFWSVIKHMFPSASNGSRIVVTTRKATVVESFHSPSCRVVVKELKTWPREQAWELFCKKAFPRSSCPPELKNLSRKILSKCQGLPLAIVAVAGLLSRKNNSRLDWQRVLDSLDYEFKEHRELSSVSKVLLLSYHDLPYYLRICLLYFGVFPEDSLVFEGRLSKIWIAEGFIELRNDKTLEQIANEYLSELISRNLVSFELRYGIYRFCKVHDLIREIIQKGASDLCFYQLFDKNKQNLKEAGRRLVIYDTTKNVLESVCDLKLRSIVLVNTSQVSNSFVAGLFKKCKLLRVVDFKETLVDNVSDIGNLLHLKYLNLRGSKVKTLPKSIGNLCNLQTLDVSDTLVRELPREINKLHKLRHLLCGTFDLAIKFSVKSHTGVTLHEGFGMLEELQTLGTVEACLGDVGFMKELQKLSKLKILGVSKVSAKMFKALGKSIEEMKDLEQLFLASIDNKEVLDLEFLSSPPLFLRYLQLNCRLRKFPTWVSQLHSLQGLELNFLRLVEEPLKHLKGLPNLAFLRLYEAYDGEELRFEKGSFPKLKKLCISRLQGLKVIKIGRGALVILEELHIGRSPMIKEMPFNLRHLKNLKLLKFYDMPMEFANSLRPDGGSEYFKIQHISSVIFKYGKGSMWPVESFEVERSEILQHQAEQQESVMHFLSSVTSHHLSAL